MVNSVRTIACDLKDEDILVAKGSKTNVIIAFGSMSNKIVILNPTSAQAAKDKFRDVEGEAPYDDCLVEVIGFDEALHAYDVSGIEH